MNEMLPEHSETVLSTLRTLLAVLPYLSPQFFSSSLFFVLIMTHCYWVLLRPPTKVGQWGGGVAYIYIYIYAGEGFEFSI